MSAKNNVNSSAEDCGCDPYLLSLVESKEVEVKKPKSFTGLFLAGATGLTALGISALCFPFVAPALRRICLPYVPASTSQVENVVKALTLRNAKGRLIDLGSGDGRIVFAAARNGFQSHGVELNRVLVFFSKMKAIKEGLRNATFSRQDLFKVNYSNYDNVVIFGVNEMMPELEVLFQKSLKPNSHVIACRFPLPNSEPCLIIGEGIDTVWVYQTK